MSRNSEFLLGFFGARCIDPVQFYDAPLIYSEIHETETGEVVKVKQEKTNVKRV